MKVPYRFHYKGVEYIPKNIVDDMLTTAKEEIIKRIREEIDKIYEKYEGHPLIDEDDIMSGFEDIIIDYCEEKSLM